MVIDDEANTRVELWLIVSINEIVPRSSVDGRRDVSINEIAPKSLVYDSIFDFC